MHVKPASDVTGQRLGGASAPACISLARGSWPGACWRSYQASRSRSPPAAPRHTTPRSARHADQPRQPSPACSTRPCQKRAASQVSNASMSARGSSPGHRTGLISRRRDTRSRAPTPRRAHATAGAAAQPRAQAAAAARRSIPCRRGCRRSRDRLVRARRSRRPAVGVLAQPREQLGVRPVPVADGSAAARALDAEVLELAVAAAVRHQHTRYDELLMSGVGRDQARPEVRSRVAAVLDGWRRS
jgi:hypothetical protein